MGIITDPVGDLLTRIRNAAQNRSYEVTVPYSRLKNDIAEVLKQEGYLSEIKKVDHDLILTLTYLRRRPIISGIENVSKPGLKIYRNKKELPRPLGGAGISIISTSQGVMSNREARKRGLGGEVLGKVW